MAEPIEGALVWRQTKHGMRPAVKHPTRKGEATTNVPPGELHPDLAEPQVGETPVHLDLVKGQPARVRPRGTGWAAAPENLDGVKFHNPYVFAPAPEPGKAFLDSPFGHRAPCGHHRRHEQAYSGVIELELTAETPLLLTDPASIERDAQDHATISTLRDPRDRSKPQLRPTSLKGALRAAYETITNSRFGVFPEKAHADPLARRMDAREGLGMVPVRVVSSANGLELEFWLGSHADRGWPDAAPDGRPGHWSVPGNVMYAAWLPQYNTRGDNQRGPAYDRRALTYPGGLRPRHGDEVACWLEKVVKERDNKPVFTYWRVAEIAEIANAGALSKTPPRKAPVPQRRDHHGTGEMIPARGFVCVTGQNIGKKHDERVFFLPLSHTAQPPAIPLDDALKTRYEALIRNYQALHRDEIAKRRAPPDAYLGKDINQTAFSRHVFDKDDLKLRDGALLYARIDAGRNVVGLYPVQIARELARQSPWDLLPDTLRPAMDYDALSPADRVFGWVHPSAGDAKGEAEKQKPTAHRGQLRIRDVRCETENAIETVDGPAGLPLAILSSPKPSQAAFYAAGDRQGAPLTGDPSYDRARALRGRKLYPHHKGLPEGYWSLSDPSRIGGRWREYRRTAQQHQAPPHAPDPLRDDQNRSARDWVKPGASFLATIEITNLSREELAALVWLCALGDGADRFVRLGAGKPLGFGSMRAKVRRMEVRDGKALRARYASLTPVKVEALREGDVADLRAEFEAAIAAAWGVGDVSEVPFVARFLKAAEGYEKPVHYPRASSTPDPKGENFKWYVNARRAGTFAALPDHGGLDFPSQEDDRRGGGPRRGR